jgi:hypothetical protein
MREQIQRLNKTPGTEVQQGVLQTGVTQTPTMGYVQQKESKGSKLAKTLGMVTDTAIKGYELYQGQKDEEAMSQFYTDRLTTIEEMNALNSDADRALYLQDKMRSLSNEGVNEKYRESFIKTFSGSYSKALAGAKIEGYKAQENELFKRLSTDINGEDFNYDNLMSEFGTRVRKENVHGLYATAILQNAQIDIADVKTKEDLKEFNAKYNNLFKVYNSNPYAGGSKSKDALDIQVKLKKNFDTIVKSKDKVFKENYQVQKALVERDYSMTPDLYDRFVDNSEYQDRSDAVKSKAAYRKEYEAKQNQDIFEGEFELHNATNNANYEMLNAKQKTYVNEQVSKNISYSLESGAYFSLVNTVSKNTKASDAIIKSFFNTNTTDPNMLNAQMTAYNNLKNTRDGDLVLYGVSKNDRTALEILSVYPETDPQMIREVLNSELIKDGQYGEKNKYYKDWQKVIATLSPKDAEVANSLRQYAFNTNGRDAKDSIDFVKDNFVPSVSKEISGTKFLGRIEEVEAEQLNTQIETVFEGFEYNTVEVLEDGSIRVFDSDLPFVSAKVTTEDLKKAQKGILAAQQIEKKIDEAINQDNTLTEGISEDIITDVKKGIVDLYKNNSEIIGTLETEGTTPDIITKLKDGIKSWSNRVNGTNFKLSTDSDYNESTKQVDDVVDTVLDAIGPTKAQGSEIKTLFSNVGTINESSTGITQDMFLASNYNAASQEEQQIWLSNANRQVETPTMKKNLTAVENIVENTKAYNTTLNKYNISKDDLKTAIKKVYSAETHYGTSQSKVSNTGALGELQVLVSTARDLTKSGKQYFGNKAAKEANINLTKFNKDKAYAKDVLLNNKKANVLFAIAKILSSYKSTQLKGE